MLKNKRPPAVFPFALLAACLLLLCPADTEARETVYVPGDYPTIQDAINTWASSDDNSAFDRGGWGGRGNPSYERFWVSSPINTIVIRLGYEHDVQEFFIHNEDNIIFAPQLFIENPMEHGWFCTEHESRIGEGRCPANNFGNPLSPRFEPDDPDDPSCDWDDWENIQPSFIPKSNRTLIIKGSPTRGATLRGGGAFLLNADWTSGGGGHTLILENIIFEGAPGANLQDAIRNTGGSVEIRNCEFRNIAGEAVWLDRSPSDISNVTIQDVGTGVYSNSRLDLNYSTITGAADFGIYRDGQGTNIYQSEISNSSMGVYITGPDLFDPNHHSIEYSILENNEFGLFISTNIWEPTFNIRNNSFAGNTEYGLYNQASGFNIDAPENYWGDEGGPSGVGEGAGAAVSDYVNFAPWYVNPEMTVLSDGTPPAPPPEPRPRPADTSEAPRPSGDCFIATATFGSYESREVKAFRDFRDLFLLESEPGRRIINFYYMLSPAGARIIAGNRLLRTAARLHLMPGSTALMLINR